MNLCSPCGEDFSAVKTFDAHRVGRHQPLERRCLTVREMAALGWEKNSRGAWYDPVQTAAAREAFKKPDSAPEQAVEVTGVVRSTPKASHGAYGAQPTAMEVSE